MNNSIRDNEDHGEDDIEPLNRDEITVMMDELAQHMDQNSPEWSVYTGIILRLVTQNMRLIRQNTALELRLFEMENLMAHDRLDGEE